LYLSKFISNLNFLFIYFIIMDEDIVCYCKAVLREDILEAIYKYSAKTIEDIQRETLASTGCGRCTNHVKNILKEELIKLEKNG